MKKENLGKARRFDPIISSARETFRASYLKKDRKNNRESCDFETFFKLSQLPCHYCGSLPSRTYNVAGHNYTSENQKQNGNFVYNGLDRIDSTKGHTSDNIVPCCWKCNRAKAAMTLDEFKEWIQSLYHNLFPAKVCS